MDNNRNGASGQQRPKEQERRQDSRSGQDSSIPWHLRHNRTGPQSAGPAGPTTPGTLSSEQSASFDASRQQQRSAEQSASARLGAYRPPSAQHPSQQLERPQQSSRDPGLKASTGSRSTIRDLLNSHGIYLKNYAPDQYSGIPCPKCKGGSSSEDSLSVKIEDDSQSATWLCHRATCGWASGCSLRSDSAGAPGVSGVSVMAPMSHAVFFLRRMTHLLPVRHALGSPFPVLCKAFHSFHWCWEYRAETQELSERPGEHERQEEGRGGKAARHLKSPAPLAQDTPVLCSAGNLRGDPEEESCHGDPLRRHSLPVLA